MNNIFDYALASTANIQLGFFEGFFTAIIAFLGIWFWVLVVLIMVPMVISYIYHSLCLVKIAEKTKTFNSWFAWVPILNIYLVCKVAGKSGAWVFWLLIPIINIIPSIILSFAIVKRLKKSAWWAALMLLPVTNIVVPGILAFSEDDNIVTKEELTTPSAKFIPKKQIKQSGSDKKFCSGCGGELQVGDKFCLNCGTKL